MIGDLVEAIRIAAFVRYPVSIIWVADMIIRRPDPREVLDRDAVTTPTADPVLELEVFHARGELDPVREGGKTVWGVVVHRHAISQRREEPHPALWRAPPRARLLPIH